MDRLPGNGSGRINTWSAIEKLAVVAPMPSAATTIAVMVKPGVRPQRSDRVAHVLPRDVDVHARGVDEGVDKRPGEHQADTPVLPEIAGEHCAHLFAVFRAERRGVEAQQRAIEPHDHALFGDKAAGARQLDEVVEPRASARATALPNW